MDDNILNKMIVGRVEPHIYAFETHTVPNFLKVGDTYRPVEIRLDEWRKYYKDLQKKFDERAVLGDYYFRDYAVHQYLRDNDFYQINPDVDKFEGVGKVSIEFFRGVIPKDIYDAFADINKSYKNHEGRYDLYKLENLLSEERPPVHYERDKEPWTPRKNQQEVINNFWHAYHDLHQKKLLMYAVMRFGKSFTALQCARRMDAKMVIVVCGKTDVKDEWQQNVEKPPCFEGYNFVTADNLRGDHSYLTKIFGKNERAVVFLTLQDLLGDDIKTKHKELFNLNDAGKLDMLIVDETHFAARSEKTGRVLSDEEKKYNGEEDISKDEKFENIANTTKHFKPKVTLHLSGTPYRILLDGEFEESQIIANVQYSDITDAKEEWDEDNLKTDEKKEEWDNPYFGFPQMVRFAFRLNKSSIAKLEQLKKDGVHFLLNHLLEPVETHNKAGHDKFVNEREILDLLHVIDGSQEDDNILSFLDNERIQKGQLCHHVVMVLPFKSSCDAMTKLIGDNKRSFIHLGEYKILNISGHNAPRRYTDGDYVKAFKEDIAQHESQGEKTLTLTVGRMLTGSTVREWDTMIYLRDTESPQAYDQAIFRLQSQFVVNTNKDKEGKFIKYNMKPQTILVDFDPTRMFALTTKKAIISNANKEENGREYLESRLGKELSVSPIICINGKKLQEVTPTNIIDELRDYSANRSILDETLSVDVDSSVLDDDKIRTEIEKQAEMNGNGGIFSSGHVYSDEEDDDDGFITPDANTPQPQQENKRKPESKKDKEASLSKKIQSYYFKMMLFAYLYNKPVRGMQDIIDAMRYTKEGERIGKNLGLDAEVLALIKEKINFRILRELEDKIENSNDHGDPDDPDAVEKALRRFGKISKTEIVTPSNIADEMVSRLPENVTAKSVFLDIAAKQGEFALALIRRYGDEVKNNIYSIPTSGVTYECTRKIYTLKGIPVDHIYTFTSFDLIDENKKEKVIAKLNMKNFDVVVGNPPYNQIRGTEKSTSNRSFATALYPAFIDASVAFSPKYITLITPSRWMTKQGQGIEDSWVESMINGNHFVEIKDYPTATDCFPNNAVEIKGGVNYFLFSPKYNGKCSYEVYANGHITQRIDFLNSLKANVVVRDINAIPIIKHVMNVEGVYFDNKAFSSIVSPKHFFDRNEQLNSNWKGYSKEKNASHPIKYYLNKKLEEKGYGWIRLSDIPKNQETVKLNKVYIPMAGGTGNDSQILGKPFYGEPESACSYTYLVIGYDAKKHHFTKEQCENIIKYIQSKFFRYMVSIKKKTQNTTRELFQFVPLQDFTASSDIDWSKSVEDIDKQLYKKYGLEQSEIDFIEKMIKPME